MIFPHRGAKKSSSLDGALAMFITAVLLLAGTLLPGWSIGEAFMRGWPLYVIGAGLSSLVKHILQAPFRGRLDLLGPALVITFGVLFALNTLAGAGIHKTWPAMLVVFALGIIAKKLLTVPLLPFLRRRL